MSVDWSRARFYGINAGITLAFICAIGMVEAFDSRSVINPGLTLGIVALIWVPPLLAYLATRRKALEGFEAEPAGAQDLGAGALVGAISGLILVVFVWGVDALLEAGVAIRDVFPRLSPAMIEIVTFGRGLGAGLTILFVGCVVLATAGAALHLLSRPVRRGIEFGLLYVLAFSLLEPVVTDILEDNADALYARTGGLKPSAAAVIFLLTGAITAWTTHRDAPSIRTRYGRMDLDVQRRVTIAGVIISVALFGILPRFLGGIMNELLANIGLFVLMALGLNVVIGLAGILDLGYVAFFAVGAYGTAVLTSPGSPAFSPELSWWVALPIVIILATLAGLVVGTPVIRMRGDYLAIVTLGFGEIVRILFLSDWLSSSFGGSQGIRQIPGIEWFTGEIKGVDPERIFYMVAIFVLVAVYVSWRLQYSRIGRSWMAMREDETVAEAMGINTVTAKLLAFIIGAILASWGGAIFAAKVGSVFPNSFELLVSIIVLVVVIVGGMGNIPGVILGAALLIGVLGGPTQPGLLQEFQEYKLLIYGALLVVVMLVRPEGLLPSTYRSRELHHEEMDQDAWLKAGVGAGIDEEELAT